MEVLVSLVLNIHLSGWVGRSTRSIDRVVYALGRIGLALVGLEKLRPCVTSGFSSLSLWWGENIQLETCNAVQYDFSRAGLRMWGSYIGEDFEAC